MKRSDTEIGKQIAKLRKTCRKKDGKKLTQEDLANAIGLSRTIIAKIENGFQPLTAGQLYDIAKFFGCSADFIISGISASNTTVADDLGLSQKAIERLKKTKSAIIDRDGNKDPERTENEILFSVNRLLEYEDGIKVLKMLCNFFILDFDHADYSIDRITVENGLMNHYKESNNESIKTLEFRSLVPGMGGCREIPTHVMKQALLLSINEKLNVLRKKILDDLNAAVGE